MELNDIVFSDVDDDKGKELKKVRELETETLGEAEPVDKTVTVETVLDNVEKPVKLETANIAVEVIQVFVESELVDMNEFVKDDVVIVSVEGVKLVIEDGLVLEES